MEWVGAKGFTGYRKRVEGQGRGGGSMVRVVVSRRKVVSWLQAAPSVADHRFDLVPHPEPQQHSAPPLRPLPRRHPHQHHQQTAPNPTLPPRNLLLPP